MPWDRSRRVPWRRLAKMYVIYLVVANVVLYAFYRQRYTAGMVANTSLVGLFYGGLLAILVKFGHDPFRSFRRPLRARASAAPSTRPPAVTERAKPAPTRRTSTGSNHPRPKKR